MDIREKADAHVLVRDLYSAYAGVRGIHPMVETRVWDVRSGLTPEVLAGFRRAQRVSLAVKDNRTAVLGFWVGDELQVALIESEPLVMLVRRGPPLDLGGSIQKFSPRHATRPVGGVLFDTDAAGADAFWSRLLGLLREGDIVRLGEDHDKPGLVLLHVYVDKSRVASIRVPRNHQARSVA